MKRNYARERSEVARKARPLGEFIVQARAHEGKVPPPPVVPTPTKGRRRKPKTEREAPVLHDCLHWLKQHGVFAYRCNTGTAWINGQPVSFGYPGAADITGILPDGRRLEIECKSPTGRQSAKQKRYQEKIEANHGVYLLVRSVSDLEEGCKSLLCAKTAD